MENKQFEEIILQFSRAYERLVEEQGEELSLPGLPYTPRQMFWLSGASVWCNVMREEALNNFVLTDPHSPPRSLKCFSFLLECI